MKKVYHRKFGQHLLLKCSNRSGNLDNYEDGTVQDSNWFPNFSPILPAFNANLSILLLDHNYYVGCNSILREPASALNSGKKKMKIIIEFFSRSAAIKSIMLHSTLKHTQMDILIEITSYQSEAMNRSRALNEAIMEMLHSTPTLSIENHFPSFPQIIQQTMSWQ